MPYRFEGRHPLAAEVRRVFHEEAVAAIACLEQTDCGDRGKSIHEARKSVKKMRALLRLVKAHLPKRTSREENAQLRDAGRRLSELRDSQAVIEAFEKVREHLGLRESILRAAAKLLATRQQNIMQTVDLNAVILATAEDLREADRRAAAWKLTSDGFSLVETGLEKSYKRGRHARTAARKERTAEAFHAWRKRVKEHWYHTRLLSGVESKDWNSRAQSLKTFETLLGDDHNLAVLIAIFKADNRFAPVSGKLAEVSLQLRDEALDLGSKLYKKKWSAVADVLGDAHATWPALPPKRSLGRAHRKRDSSAVA